MAWILRITKFLEKFLNNSKCLIGLVAIIFVIFGTHLNTTVCVAIAAAYCLIIGILEIISKNETNKSEC